MTLPQILLAREERAARQQQVMEKWKTPIVSFTMNIPGPVKNAPLIRRSFRHGLARLEEMLPGWLHREIREAVTGCEAIYAVDLEGSRLKALCVSIEEENALGRLFDLDVLTPGGVLPDRLALGGSSRNCIVCGAKGRGCASRRLHSLDALTAAAWGRMEDHFFPEDAAKLGDLAVQSLLQEVRTTPKPGLVDQRNNGSHPDMDLALFTASAESLRPYYIECVRIGRETRNRSPEDCFLQLRAAGLEAERAMYRATGGINTHKGAIFTLGLLCGGFGRLWGEEWPAADGLLEVCAALGRCALAADFGSLTEAKTAGERLYLSKGIRGIRGEAAEGLPSVKNIALPACRKALARGLTPNDAGVVTLLHLIAQVEDTNLIKRGGEAGAAWAAAEAKKLLPWPNREQVEALDDTFIQRNLSPGGCADLLAAAYFLEGLGNCHPSGP